ncbi:MAG: hypothetical protein ABWZ91_13105 [Nocardioides sp.]
MTVRCEARASIDVPADDIDVDTWIFGLSDAEYQACARGHRAAGTFVDEAGRGSINVESIGGNLLIQHYRPTRAERSHVVMHSPTSRIYLLHVVPAKAAVTWTLTTTRTTDTSCRLTCVVEVGLHPVLRALGRLMAVRPLLQRHVDEEVRGFAADIARKLTLHPASAAAATARPSP